METVRSRWLFALTLPAVGLLPVVGTADAASCKAMTVGYAFSSGNVVALEPQHVDIAYGGCVQFTNNVDLDVTITVAGGYSVTLGPKESTPPKDAYVGRTTGRHGVTARSGPSSADGSITVGSAPPPPRSASPTTTPPPPQHTASPTGQPAPAPAPSSSAT